MPISGKLFPGQEKEEKVFLLIRKHWFNYLTFGMLAFLALIPILISVFIWIANPSIFSGQLGDFIVFGLSIFVLFILGLLLYGFVNYYLDIYIITDRRLVDILQDGFFKRSISELHLLQVQDVNARVEGMFETLMHFGDVYIQTAGERENFVFKSIPHPYTIAKTIIDLHEIAMDKPKRKKLSLGASEADDSGLPFELLEQKTKELFDCSTLSERIKKHGTVACKEISGQFDNFVESEVKKPKKTQTMSKKEIIKHIDSGKIYLQGEMSEGREIKFQ